MGRQLVPRSRPTSDVLSVDVFKALISKLVATPEFFTPEDLQIGLAHLFAQNLVHPAQAGAFLTALHLRRIDRRPDMIAAAANLLRTRTLVADIEGQQRDFIVDIVGTGGDGFNTFNVSTAAAIVAAGAGARVCKHGSSASSSPCGSADLLEELGCLFPLPSANTPVHFPAIPFTFIRAPHYNPTIEAMYPLRKTLPFRTIFNILGPLVNPARPRGMVVGVTERELGEPFACSLRDGGVELALVVCGAEGLDEISCAGETHAWKLENGKVTEFKLHPSQFGLPLHPLADVEGGSPTQNAQCLRDLLTSGSSIPERMTPVLDFVLLNASALLFVAGLAKDFKHGVELARGSITNGGAWEALMTFKTEGEKAFAAVDQEKS